MMKYDIFISYSRDDKSLVHPFADYISRAISRECWIDLKGIESGDEFEDVIMKAIDECQVVLFMLSDNSLISPWTKREVLYADDEGKRIVPVLVNGDNLRGWFKFHFGNVDYIDIKSEEQKEKLVANLKSWLTIDNEPFAEGKEKTGDDEKKEDGIEDKYGEEKELNNDEEVCDISSGVSTENKFIKASKINEISNVISNLWNRTSSVYKWIICSVLLIILALPFLKWCQSEVFVASIDNAESLTIDSQEMSQRLTEAIASNDARTLREFAIIHDSIRAYMPYAQICLNHGEFDTADTIAEKIVEISNDKTLKSIVQHKRDSVAQVAMIYPQKQLCDSLLKAAESLYINRKYEDARESVIKMDGKYRSRQDVQQLLSKIDAAIANDLAEAKFDSLYNAAQTQYKNKQFKTAKKTLEIMDGNYLSRPKAKDLFAAIEKAITQTDDEVYQEALKNKDWSAIEKMANKGYSKAYYQLAQWYYTNQKYTIAKKWANKSVNAGINVVSSKTILNKIIKEENYVKGSKLYQQWVVSGDSVIREKAIQSLQNADLNNQVVKNMLNELKKKRVHNPILH